MPNNNNSPPPERVTLPDGSVYEKYPDGEWWTFRRGIFPRWTVADAALCDALLATQRALAAAQQDRERVNRLEELIDSMAVEDLLSEIGDRWFALAAHGKADLRAAIDATLSASSGAARGAGAADDADD